MKTPYYNGSLTLVQHEDGQNDDELRERMLEHRLLNRDDVRDIYVVTAPITKRLSGPRGASLLRQASKGSKSDLSWAMHWAIQVGDHYFELQRAHYDPTRTGLRMSKWDQEREKQILNRYRQGVTAMTDDEIKAVGDKHFARLNRMHINKYDLWCNNCQVAVDLMLRDIGGLAYYRSKLESLHEWIRQFFCDSILSITRIYYRRRGCDEEVIARHEKVLNNTLEVITARSMHYPKRQWIREDILEAEGIMRKMGTVKDHWFLTIIESSLSLRKGSENSYVRRGTDGKPELNFDAVREAVKGIFDEDERSTSAAWLKALPWLTAGFLVGTPRWAFAVISVAVQQVSESTETSIGLNEGMEQSLAGLGLSPKLQDAASMTPTGSKPRSGKKPTGNVKKAKSKSHSADNKLVARYERCLTKTGVPYFVDNMKKERTWDAPEQQEMCLRILDPPLSRRWEERKEDSRVLYINRLTGETTDVRPGATEIWAVKKRIPPDWVRSTTMALPIGWELCRTEDGERYYLDHSTDPPTTTSVHPMRQEIEDERHSLLPVWNVEWDEARGKKYRNMQTKEIRWKAIDGPQYEPESDETQSFCKKPPQDFVEPLPPGWKVMVEPDGQKIYSNAKDRVERRTHPYSDKRRRLLPDWEMRYTRGNRRYWVHHGRDGRGTTWWTRNRLLKNTSLKNDACGWKLARNKQDWEWFHGGDVAHSEIPVLDTDDPMEIEFREYPFILPRKLISPEGMFLEPVPSNWAMRKGDDGNMYYWNFKEQARFDQHPNEEERKNLPAMWEMRYTRYGRQYFIDQGDGSTWWTHPREDKREQKLRALAGQRQDGWKLAEIAGVWERFEECADISLAERTMSDLSLINPEGDLVNDVEGSESWQSLAFTRDWLKGISSNQLLTAAVTRFREQTKSLSGSERLPNLGQWLLDIKRENKQKEGSEGSSETIGGCGPQETIESNTSGEDVQKIWGWLTSEKLGPRKKSSKTDKVGSISQTDDDVTERSARLGEGGLGLRGISFIDTSVEVLSAGIEASPDDLKEQDLHVFEQEALPIDKNDLTQASQEPKVELNELEQEPSALIGTADTNEETKARRIAQRIKETRENLTRQASDLLAKQRSAEGSEVTKEQEWTEKDEGVRLAAQEKKEAKEQKRKEKEEKEEQERAAKEQKRKEKEEKEEQERAAKEQKRMEKKAKEAQEKADKEQKQKEREEEKTKEKPRKEQKRKEKEEKEEKERALKEQRRKEAEEKQEKEKVAKEQKKREKREQEEKEKAAKGQKRKGRKEKPGAGIQAAEDQEQHEESEPAGQGAEGAAENLDGSER